MSHDGDLQNFTSVHPGNQRLSLRSRRLEVMGAEKNEARERERHACLTREHSSFLDLDSSLSPRTLPLRAATLVSNVNRRWGGGTARKIASFETVPSHLRFETHPQTLSGTLETKMAACKGRRMITTILRKNRGL